jgi:2'-5' RNA ligase
MRLFFALWPPRAAAEALHGWAMKVHGETGGRVTRLETIHLTLAFLGDVDQEKIIELKKLRIKGEKHALPIEQARFWKRNDIVWAGPRETPAPLAEVADSLRSYLKARQFRLEEREFAAHITLIRKARAPGLLPELPKISWPVEEVLLVRSHLSSSGSSYEVRQRYPLS